MSPTPEKADPDICYSTSAFPGEPTYHCSIAGWHPHKLHDDGEHHRWFDAIPDLPIAAWQATLLEQFGDRVDGSRTADAVVSAARNPDSWFHYQPPVMMTGHENTDRVLLEQAERNARAFDDLRLTELQRQTDAKIREIAANVQMPQHYWPAEYVSLEALTAELRRLDHEIAMVRMASAQYPLSEATLRERREAVRKEREKRAKLEAWYDVAAVPLKWFGGVSSAEALAEREAPRLAQFEAFREAFASPFRQLMEAAKKGGDEMAKKKIEDLHLPKAEYMFRPGTNTLVPVDPEAAKVDHVMTRRGGEIFGIARVSREPIPDGTTIRTEKTEDLRLGPYTVSEPVLIPDDDEPSVEWKEPTPLAEAYRAEALEKILKEDAPLLERLAAGEVRTTSSTGGQKGVKPARFDLIPVMPLTKLAEHYGIGAAKYADHNWRKGYEISKNYAAAQRHLTAFWDGEDLDPETGTPHLAAVTFHAFAMMQTLQDFPQHDDRYKKEA